MTNNFKKSKNVRRALKASIFLITYGFCLVQTIQDLDTKINSFSVPVELDNSSILQIFFTGYSDKQVYRAMWLDSDPGGQSEAIGEFKVSSVNIEPSLQAEQVLGISGEVVAVKHLGERRISFARLDGSADDDLVAGSKVDFGYSQGDVEIYDRMNYAENKLFFVNKNLAICENMEFESLSCAFYGESDQSFEKMALIRSHVATYEVGNSMVQLFDFSGVALSSLSNENQVVHLSGSKASDFFIILRKWDIGVVKHNSNTNELQRQGSIALSSEQSITNSSIVNIDSHFYAMAYNNNTVQTLSILRVNQTQTTQANQVLQIIERTSFDQNLLYDQELLYNPIHQNFLALLNSRLNLVFLGSEFSGKHNLCSDACLACSEIFTQSSCLVCQKKRGLVFTAGPEKHLGSCELKNQPLSKREEYLVYLLGQIFISIKHVCFPVFFLYDIYYAKEMYKLYQLLETLMSSNTFEHFPENLKYFSEQALYDIFDYFPNCFGLTKVQQKDQFIERNWDIRIKNNISAFLVFFILFLASLLCTSSRKHKNFWNFWFSMFDLVKFDLVTTALIGLTSDLEISKTWFFISVIILIFYFSKFLVLLVSSCVKNLEQNYLRLSSNISRLIYKNKKVQDKIEKTTFWSAFRYSQILILEVLEFIIITSYVLIRNRDFKWLSIFYFSLFARLIVNIFVITANRAWYKAIMKDKELDRKSEEPEIKINQKQKKSVSVEPTKKEKFLEKQLNKELIILTTSLTITILILVTSVMASRELPSKKDQYKFIGWVIIMISLLLTALNGGLATSLASRILSDFLSGIDEKVMNKKTKPVRSNQKDMKGSCKDWTTSWDRRKKKFPRRKEFLNGQRDKVIPGIKKRRITNLRMNRLKGSRIDLKSAFGKRTLVAHKG